MKPMLAFRFQDKRKYLRFPCHVQPKLNGVRLVYHDGIMWSRSHGKEHSLVWAPQRLRHLRYALANVSEDLILDGELYKHGWSLQKINGAVAIKRLEDSDVTQQIEYHIFDCIVPSELSMPFSERIEVLRETFIGAEALFPHVFVVPTSEQPSLELAEAEFTMFKQLGYEGAMYRQSDSPYGISEACKNKENRWSYLLKRKDWLDDWFVIVGFVITTGEKGERGFSMTCRMSGGKTFNVGSGLSNMELDLYEDEPPIGYEAHVKFEMYSDRGIPLKPTIIELR